MDHYTKERFEKMDRKDLQTIFARKSVMTDEGYRNLTKKEIDDLRHVLRSKKLYDGGMMARRESDLKKVKSVPKGFRMVKGKEKSTGNAYVLPLDKGGYVFTKANNRVDAWDKLKYEIPESLRKKKSYTDVLSLDKHVLVKKPTEHQAVSKSKKTLDFQVEVYNSIQGVYPDVHKTKKCGSVRAAKMFGEEHADGRVDCYRITDMRTGKIIFDQGE